jgi:hypothetical protein
LHGGLLLRAMSDLLLTGIALGMVLMSGLYEFVFPWLASYLTHHGWE